MIPLKVRLIGGIDTNKVFLSYFWEETADSGSGSSFAGIHPVNHQKICHQNHQNHPGCVRIQTL